MKKSWSRERGSRAGVYSQCLKCGKAIYTIPSRVISGRGNYCSHRCSAISNHYRKLARFSGGKIAQEAGRKALTKFNKLVRSGEILSPVWKGSDVSYGALHEWIVRLRGNPTKCEMCGTDDPSERYEWANTNHEYRRDLNDYKRMCVTCHRIFDFTAARERRKLNGISRIDFVPKS